MKSLDNSISLIIMLSFCLIILIVASGDAGDTEASHDCQLRTSEVCRADELPNSLPGSKQELEIACNAIKDYMLCGISVEERCNFQPGSIPPAHKFLALVNEICDKDSQLHKDVVENLECIKGFMEERIGLSCLTPFPDEEIIEKHKKDLIDQGVIKSDEVNNRTCFDAVHALACFALKMKNKCGEVAMNAFVKIMTKTPSQIVLEECDDDIEELLPIAVSLHKLEEANEAKLKDICNKPLEETCIPGEAALSFPGNPEELDSACEAEIEFMECTIQVEEKCKFNPGALPDLTESLESTRKVCNKDTALYEGVAANIECLKPLADDSFGDCQNSTLDKGKIEAYAASLQRESLPVFTISEEDQADCAKGLYAFACSARKVEKHCGEKAMEALLTVLSSRTQPLTKTCSKEFYEHLLDVIRVLKVEEEEEEEIESFFENIMK